MTSSSAADARRGGAIREGAGRGDGAEARPRQGALQTSYDPTLPRGPRGHAKLSAYIPIRAADGAGTVFAGRFARFDAILTPILVVSHGLLPEKEE